jgi:ATP-dependent DNA helicase RecQ
VDFTEGDRPMAVLTEAGRAVMKAERPARLLLPSREKAASARVGRARDRSPRRAAVDSSVLHDADGAAAVFRALRDHRLALARAQGVPPYVVASDRTLREIATARPRTVAELMHVYGIGEAKAARYGRGFLEVVARSSP